jgi:hypothetical protein
MHARKEDGRLDWRSHGKPVKILSWDEQVTSLMRKRGVPEHMISTEVERSRRELAYHNSRARRRLSLDRERRRKEAREAAHNGQAGQQ